MKKLGEGALAFCFLLPFVDSNDHRRFLAIARDHLRTFRASFFEHLGKSGLSVGNCPWLNWRRLQPGFCRQPRFAPLALRAFAIVDIGSVCAVSVAAVAAHDFINARVMVSPS